MLCSVRPLFPFCFQFILSSVLIGTCVFVSAEHSHCSEVKYCLLSAAFYMSRYQVSWKVDYKHL